MMVALVSIASGGSIPFEYTWDNGTTNSEIKNLGPGEYQVTVIDENDCINTSGYTLEDIPLVDFVLEIKDFDCEGELTSLEVIGDNIYDYPIYINDIKANLDENDQIVNLGVGTYSLSYQINETCIIFIEEIEIASPEEIQISLNIESVDLKYGDLQEVTLEIINGLPLSGFSIDWELINHFECTETFQEGQCQTILITASENEVLEVIFTDSRGCIITLSAEIRVDKTVDIHIPNIFSPNGDGINDNFTIISNYLDLPIHRFMIFDRWGNNVFYQGNVLLSNMLPWNGLFGNKEVNDGVYVYLVEYITEEGEHIIKAGDVTLIK